MGWQDYIHSSPDIMVGKPVIKGTRLTVELLIGLYKIGWSEEQILSSYPQLTKDSLRSIFDFMTDCLKDELIFINSK